MRSTVEEMAVAEALEQLRGPIHEPRERYSAYSSSTEPPRPWKRNHAHSTEPSYPVQHATVGAIYTIGSAQQNLNTQTVAKLEPLEPSASLIGSPDDTKGLDIDSDMASPPQNYVPNTTTITAAQQFTSLSGQHQPPGRWQGVLLGAASFLLPASTRKRLSQFVRMLRLANEDLSRKIVALKEAADAESKGTEPKLSASAIRQDIMLTIRKATTVITTFTASSMPERGRLAVRQCLLALPANWASSMRNVDSEHMSESAVLSLTHETLIMIRNIVAIVDATLDRAESWCGRFKRPREEGEESECDEFDEGMLRRAPGLQSVHSADPATPTASPPTPG